MIADHSPMHFASTGNCCEHSVFGVFVSAVFARQPKKFCSETSFFCSVDHFDINVVLINGHNNTARCPKYRYTRKKINHIILLGDVFSTFLLCLPQRKKNRFPQTCAIPPQLGINHRRKMICNLESLFSFLSRLPAYLPMIEMHFSLPSNIAYTISGTHNIGGECRSYLFIC